MMMIMMVMMMMMTMTVRLLEVVMMVLMTTVLARTSGATCWDMLFGDSEKRGLYNTQQKPVCFRLFVLSENPKHCGP